MLLAAVFEFVSVTLFSPLHLHSSPRPNIMLSNRYLSALKDASEPGEQHHQSSRSCSD